MKKQIAAWIGILLNANVVCAQVPTYSADVSALKGTITLDGVKSAFTAGSAEQLLPGMGSMPQDLTKFSIASPQDLAQKGAMQLEWCVNTPKATMTDQQKAQCDAAIAASGAASERSQYNLTPDRSAVSSSSAGWAAQAERSSRLRVKSDPALGGKAPTYTVVPETCTTGTTPLPVQTIQETCSSENVASGQTCTETLTVTVDVTYTVTLTDPVTGEVTTIGTTTDEAQANNWVAANPGAVVDRKTDVKEAWSSDCPALAANQMCDEDDSGCTLGPLTKTINGEEITRACWQRTKGYTCYAATPTSTCSDLTSRGCSLVDSSCSGTRANGDCVDAAFTYSCPSGNPQQTSDTHCSGGKLCIGDQCYNTSKTPDADFATAMTYMEAAREGAVYMDGSAGGNIQLFRGMQGKCKKPVGPGIGTNCCKTSGGAVTNNQAVGGGLSASTIVGGVVASTVLSNATSIGSHYMYDFMFESGGWFEAKAFEAIKNSDGILGAWDPSASFTDLLMSPSFSMYGFTVSTSTTSILPGFITGANVDIAKSIFGTSYNLTFNPYIFAATIALNVISSLFSCSEDEQMLAMRRGANLCAKTGEYCSKKLPWPLKTCIQKTEVWCCWNSRLAKSLAMQAKCQLYGYCGNPRTCAGFSAAEFARIDFSRIDLSEFTNEMQANAASFASVVSPPVLDALQDKVNTKIETQGTNLVPNAGANSSLQPPIVIQ